MFCYGHRFSRSRGRTTLKMKRLLSLYIVVALLTISTLNAASLSAGFNFGYSGTIYRTDKEGREGKHLLQGERVGLDTSLNFNNLSVDLDYAFALTSYEQNINKQGFINMNELSIVQSLYMGSSYTLQGLHLKAGIGVLGTITTINRDNIYSIGPAIKAELFFQDGGNRISLGALVSPYLWSINKETNSTTFSLYALYTFGEKKGGTK